MSTYDAASHILTKISCKERVNEERKQYYNSILLWKTSIKIKSHHEANMGWV